MGEEAQLTFRPMTQDDADAIAELEEKSFAMPWSREDFWHEAQNELATYIVCELDGKIVAYAGAWVSFNQAEVMSVAVAPELRGQGIGTILFGELDGKIVAYAGAWVSFNQAEVMSVAVAPELRGQGVGTIIFGELIKAVKLRGATAITLEVRPSNTAAIKLYKSFGLKSVGRRKGYYLDNGEDALIMWNTKL